MDPVNLKNLRSLDFAALVEIYDRSGNRNGSLEFDEFRSFVLDIIKMNDGPFMTGRSEERLAECMARMQASPGWVHLANKANITPSVLYAAVANGGLFEGLFSTPTHKLLHAILTERGKELNPLARIQWRSINWPRLVLLYDTNRNGVLDRVELLNMMEDLVRLREQELDSMSPGLLEAEIREKAREVVVALVAGAQAEGLAVDPDHISAATLRDAAICGAFDGSFGIELFAHPFFDDRFSHIELAGFGKLIAAYDVDGDGFMNSSEFTVLVRDLVILRDKLHQQPSRELIEAEVQQVVNNGAWRFVRERQVPYLDPETLRRACNAGLFAERFGEENWRDLLGEAALLRRADALSLISWQRVIDLFDVDRNGVMDQGEFRQFLRELIRRRDFSAYVTEETIDAHVELLRSTGIAWTSLQSSTGKINAAMLQSATAQGLFAAFDDFENMILRLIQDKEIEAAERERDWRTKVDWPRMVAMYDLNKNGALDNDELHLLVLDLMRCDGLFPTETLDAARELSRAIKSNRMAFGAIDPSSGISPQCLCDAAIRGAFDVQFGGQTSALQLFRHPYFDDRARQLERDIFVRLISKYDVDGDGYMNAFEFSLLVKDLCLLRDNKTHLENQDATNANLENQDATTAPPPPPPPPALSMDRVMEVCKSLEQEDAWRIITERNLLYLDAETLHNVSSAGLFSKQFPIWKEHIQDLIMKPAGVMQLDDFQRLVDVFDVIRDGELDFDEFRLLLQHMMRHRHFDDAGADARDSTLSLDEQIGRLANQPAWKVLSKPKISALMLQDAVSRGLFDNDFFEPQRLLLAIIDERAEKVRDVELACRAIDWDRIVKQYDRNRNAVMDIDEFALLVKDLCLLAGAQIQDNLADDPERLQEQVQKISAAIKSNRMAFGAIEADGISPQCLCDAAIRGAFDGFFDLSLLSHPFFAEQYALMVKDEFWASKIQQRCDADAHALALGRIDWPALVSRYDLNRNGTLSLAEFTLIVQDLWCLELGARPLPREVEDLVLYLIEQAPDLNPAVVKSFTDGRFFPSAEAELRPEDFQAFAQAGVFRGLFTKALGLLVPARDAHIADIMSLDWDALLKYFDKDGNNAMDSDELGAMLAALLKVQLGGVAPTMQQLESLSAELVEKPVWVGITPYSFDQIKSAASNGLFFQVFTKATFEALLLAAESESVNDTPDEAGVKIHGAIGRNSLPQLEALLFKWKDNEVALNFDDWDTARSTPLVHACGLANRAAVEAILLSDAPRSAAVPAAAAAALAYRPLVDVNKSTIRGTTALMFAVERDCAPIVSLLLGHPKIDVLKTILPRGERCRALDFAKTPAVRNLLEIKEAEIQSASSSSSPVSDVPPVPAPAPAPAPVAAVPPAVPALDVPYPVFLHKEEILARIAAHRVTIIAGSTGCGKSTGVPRILLRAAQEALRPCRIYMAQPKRVAVVNIYNRLAAPAQSAPLEPYYQALGSLVGYRLGGSVVEGGEKDGSAPICVCSTGYLVHLLARGLENLLDCTHLVIDEVHERSLDGDLIIYFARELLKVNSSVKLVLMSATANADLYRDYFLGEEVLAPLSVGLPDGQARLDEAGGVISVPIIYCDSRGQDGALVPEIAFAPAEMRAVTEATGQITPNVGSQQSLLPPMLVKKQYDAACRLVEHFSATGRRHTVLIFVMGLQDIVELKLKLARLSSVVAVFGIHSDGIPKDEQMQAAKNAAEVCPGKLKVVIGTNAAESSITIPDCDIVIDLGSHKQTKYNELTNRQELQPTWISQASATQRKGRTGRVRSGVCFRLYPEAIFPQMDPYDCAEIFRTPLQKTILTFRCLLDRPVRPILVQLLEPPLPTTIDRGYSELAQLQMLSLPNDDGHVTGIGRVAHRLDVDLALSQMLGMGAILGVGIEACVLASALSLRKSLFFWPPDGHVQGIEKMRRVFLGLEALDAGVMSEPIMLLRVFCDWHEMHTKPRFRLSAKEASAEVKREADTYCDQYLLVHERVRSFYSSTIKLVESANKAYPHHEPAFKLAELPRGDFINHPAHSDLVNLYRLLLTWAAEGNMVSQDTGGQNLDVETAYFQNEHTLSSRDMAAINTLVPPDLWARPMEYAAEVTNLAQLPDIQQLFTILLDSALPTAKLYEGGTMAWVLLPVFVFDQYSTSLSFSLAVKIFGSPQDGIAQAVQARVQELDIPNRGWWESKIHHVAGKPLDHLHPQYVQMVSCGIPYERAQDLIARMRHVQCTTGVGGVSCVIISRDDGTDAQLMATNFTPHASAAPVALSNLTNANLSQQANTGYFTLQENMLYFPPPPPPPPTQSLVPNAPLGLRLLMAMSERCDATRRGEPSCRQLRLGSEAGRNVKLVVAECVWWHQQVRRSSAMRPEDYAQDGSYMHPDGDDTFDYFVAQPWLTCYLPNQPNLQAVAIHPGNGVIRAVAGKVEIRPSRDGRRENRTCLALTVVPPGTRWLALALELRAFSHNAVYGISRTGQLLLPELNGEPDSSPITRQDMLACAAFDQALRGALDRQDLPALQERLVQQVDLLFAEWITTASQKDKTYLSSGWDEGVAAVRLGEAHGHEPHGEFFVSISGGGKSAPAVHPAVHPDNAAPAAPFREAIVRPASVSSSPRKLQDEFFVSTPRAAGGGVTAALPNAAAPAAAAAAPAASGTLGPAPRRDTRVPPPLLRQISANVVSICGICAGNVGPTSSFSADDIRLKCRDAFHFHCLARHLRDQLSLPSAAHAPLRLTCPNKSGCLHRPAYILGSEDLAQILEYQNHLHPELAQILQATHGVPPLSADEIVALRAATRF